MSDNQDLPRLYIMLDASNIRRCSWCGGPAIENLVSISPSIAYCSSECGAANTANGVVVISVVILSVIWVGLALLHPLGNLFLIATVIITAYLSIRGRRLRELAIPQRSRANEQPSVLSLLKSRFPFVKCPSCAEKLNLSLIGEDRIYQCQYCDATGVLEIEIAGDDSSN